MLKNVHPYFKNLAVPVRAQQDIYRVFGHALALCMKKVNSTAVVFWLFSHIAMWFKQLIDITITLCAS